MLAKLFSSRVRAAVVTAFFRSPDVTYNASELARHLAETYSAVWKELKRLEDLGILASEKRGASKDYRVDETCPIAPELRSIVRKTEDDGRRVKGKLRAKGRE
jgi:predicted transcriptional regulator